ncbi:leucine-rich repeat protein [Butyrivibrio sp. WCD3002]|uniref:leucine-rich repeat protein n=1 Tax=Butyrivibrio sp. WCD3002 TaxID=1280676 RepID=UPI000428B4FC|nr:leucine-rich repeat protein [Butyrivibrio sp. WCD3002]
MVKKRSFLKRLAAVVMAAAIAIPVVPGLPQVAEPVTAKAYYSNVSDHLTGDKLSVYRAYDYLDSRIKDKDVQITSANFKEYDSSGFYTVYENKDEKKKVAQSDVKYGRRAYVYSHPTDLASAMAELKFVYIKTDAGKYSCYAYLKRTGDNNYSAEQKQLKSAIKKIMNRIDADQKDFAIEVDLFYEMLDTVTYSACAIDNRDLRNTPYGALVKHKASYQGYALAFAVLLDEADIDNNILFSENKVWNQIRIKAGTTSTKWYETDLVYCDRKNGKISFDAFNISRNAMANLGAKRTDWCSDFPDSTGKAKNTKNALADYELEELDDESIMTLGIVEEDGSINRTTIFTTEETFKVTPVYTYTNELESMSPLLSNCEITPMENSMFEVVSQWTPATPYAVLKRVPTGTNNKLKVTLTAALDGYTASIYCTVVTQDDNRGKNSYSIKNGEAVYNGPTNKKVKNVVIPATVNINGQVYKVTKIAPKAFAKCKKLESVTIGPNIKEIGANAFTGKSKLQKVEIQNFHGNLKNKGIKSNSFKATNDETFFLIISKKSEYNKLVKGFKKAGAKDAIYKLRLYAYY